MQQPGGAFGGVGKSNSIAWLTHGLALLHTPADVALLGEGAVQAELGPNMPVFDKAVISTDRVVLDRQLQATVAWCVHALGMNATFGKEETSADLPTVLESNKARSIVAKLQKFPVVTQSATELDGSRFAVIADEAHSPPKIWGGGQGPQSLA